MADDATTLDSVQLLQPSRLRRQLVEIKTALRSRSTSQHGAKTASKLTRQWKFCISCSCNDRLAAVWQCKSDHVAEFCTGCVPPANTCTTTDFPLILEWNCTHCTCTRSVLQRRNSTKQDVQNMSLTQSCIMAHITYIQMSWCHTDFFRCCCSK